MSRKISASSNPVAVTSTRHRIQTLVWMGTVLATFPGVAPPAWAQERADASPAESPAGASPDTAPATSSDMVPAARPGAGGTELDQLGTEDAREDGKPEKPWNRGVPMEDRLKAREIYYAANSHLDIPLFAQAAEKYQEALALYPHPAIYFNLAIAQLNLVQPVASYESFRRALAHGPGPIGEEQYGHGVRYLERLEQQLGHLEIHCDQAGAEVTLDGRPIFTGPGRFEGVVVPGEHQILASKAGYLPATERVVVSAGERMEVALTLRLPERTVTERYMPAWIPWASLAAGATALGAAGYYDRQSSRALSAFDARVTERCPRGCTTIVEPDLTPRHNRAERQRHIAQGLYIAGSVVVVGSAVLLYLNRERVVSRQAPERPISILPLMSPSVAGVAARGRF